MLDKIKNRYTNNSAKPMKEYKKSAVMILLQQVDNKLFLIVEIRAKHLNTQPGDICLPGGKLEHNESSKEAAIRETIEELNLNPNDIEYIGEMDYLVTPFGMIIYPHIGVLKSNDIINPNRDEVDHILKVPVSFFMGNEPSEYDIKYGPINLDNFPFHKIRGGKNYPFKVSSNVKYFYEYNKYYIWGFTAEIIKYFIESIKDM